MRETLGERRPEGMECLSTLPDALPRDGRVLVHNRVRSTRRLGSRGFRAWLQPPDATLERCNCGWVPKLGPHYWTKFDRA